MIPSGVVLDTNVLSYILKGHPLAEAYAERIEGRMLCIAFMTVGEMYYGMEKAGWGLARRSRMEEQLRQLLIIPYDHQVAENYGRITALREAKGRPLACADGWIAACALRHKLPLVTHNAKDFALIPQLEVVTAQH